MINDDSLSVLPVCSSVKDILKTEARDKECSEGRKIMRRMSRTGAKGFREGVLEIGGSRAINGGPE